jgi:PAS domain S-box-containing protein
MAKRPTHEKLKSGTNELGAKTSELTRKDLIRFLWSAVEQSSEGIAISDLEGNLQYLNNAFAKKHGYTPDELVGKNLSIFHATHQMPSVEDANRQTKKTGEFKGEIWHQRHDGTVFPGLMHNSLIMDDRNKPIGMMGTLRDISDIIQAEEALQKSKKELERKVKKRTKELEINNRQFQELNTALKVLITKKDEDKNILEENILSNVNKLILPYLEKVKKNSLDDNQKLYLGILESNLKEIISPFSKKLSSKYMNLTPAEIQVADFVKHGKRTKEIAAILNLSFKTIESHRESIRKKLGIKNKKTNLRSYLISLY